MRTTITLDKSTKDLLYNLKHERQSYEGFILELIKEHKETIRVN